MKVIKFSIAVTLTGWLAGIPLLAATVESDVCIFGGTSAGVIAAMQAATMGKTAVVVEPGKHLGGLTASGLGWTDIGNKAAIGGLSRDFYRRLGRHYGNAEAWTFEPHVAENEFAMLLQEAKVPVHFQQRLATVKKDGARILEVSTEDGTVFRAKM